jgi:hypothetical protein
MTENNKKTSIAKPYEPRGDEKAAMQAIRAHKITTPRIKTSAKQGAVEIILDHPDALYGQALLMRALGTGEVDFFADLLAQLANASADGTQVNDQRLNFMVSVIKGIEPKDQLETMLAAQMAAVHSLTMTFARRLANVDTIPQQDSAECAFNRLARTFAAQVEALKRYRSNGEQKMTVEHVTVNQGGNAIVGNVTNRGVGTGEKREATS